ncbi:MAG: hypothetical protein AB1797_00745 [bacterium]
MRNDSVGNKIAKYFSKFLYDLGMMLVGVAMLGKLFGKESTSGEIIMVVLIAGYFMALSHFGQKQP